jgi:hypothetical protein
MNKITLDSIGITGFSHDFGAISGRQSSVRTTFDAFLTNNLSKHAISIILLAQHFPVLLSIPTRRMRMFQKFHESMHEISQELLERCRKERELGVGVACGEAEVNMDRGQSRTGTTIIGSLRK